jgi:UDP-glucose 4-epimerase
MRVAVVGATGNVGTSLLTVLGDDPGVDSILGVARRRPSVQFPKTEWAQADISRDDLVPLVRGCDAVVHLAWAIQPSRDQAALRRINVEGSRRLVRAVAEAGVPALVYASSVGAYALGPKDRRVTESWPATGIRTSFYSRHKAEVEAELDRFEREQPKVRVVRLRPGLIFKREAAEGIRRLFAGPFVISPLLRPATVPVVPEHPRFRFQAVHSLDVAEAYRLAIRSDVRGAFNVAADPVLDGAELARALDARPVRVPSAALRLAADVSWRLHVQPTPPGWVDLAFGVPLLDSTRARDELGWAPRRSATEALLELLAGIRDRAGLETPPLAPSTSGPARVRELLSGIGERF